MNKILSIARAAIPRPVRRQLRTAHRNYTFRTAFKQFLKDPNACTFPDSPIVADLIYGWGNAGWSALDEYLAASIRHTIDSEGPILECGSGLSTILIGAIAKIQGRRCWALEHTPSWAKKVRQYLEKYQIDSVTLHSAPLKDYGDFCWYDPPLDSMPNRFKLVICDGPPGDTKGGRYGLVPIMNKRLGVGCVILLDDAAREDEQVVASHWKAELGASLEAFGTAKPYMRLEVLQAT